MVVVGMCRQLCPHTPTLLRIAQLLTVALLQARLISKEKEKR
jgi:hypothetical protein